MDSYGIIKTNWGHLWSITLSPSITPLNAVTGSDAAKCGWAAEELACLQPQLDLINIRAESLYEHLSVDMCWPTFIIELLPIKYNHERASRPTYPLLGQANYGLENDILWLSHSPSYLRKHPGGCRDTVMRLAMSSPPGPMWRIASRLSWHRQTRKSCITCFSWLLNTSYLAHVSAAISKTKHTKLFQENRQSFGRTWCFVFVAFSLG